MALWRLPERFLIPPEPEGDEESDDSVGSRSVPTHQEIGYFKALSVKRCKMAEKVRALAFNHKEGEVAALSKFFFIHPLTNC